jgi:hypothetical protein
MELKTVLAAISTMDNTELNRVIEQIKLRRSMIAQISKASFGVGQMVEWDSKYGNVEVGIIVKIKPKFIEVRTTEPPARWNVHPTLLRAHN